MLDKEMVEEIKATAKSTKGLRDMLFCELDRLRRGEISAKQAQTIARLSDNILQTVKVEMEAYKHPVSYEFAQLPDYPQLDNSK